MVINLIQKSLKNVSGATFVTFSRMTKDKKVKMSHPELTQRLDLALKDKLITGKASEVQVYKEMDFQGFRHVVVVGLGPENDLTHEGVRQVAASVYDAVKALNVSEALVDFDAIGGRKDSAEMMKALVEGLNLSAYEFDELKTKKSDEEKSELVIQVATDSAKNAGVKKAFQDGLILSECVNFSRRLGDMPGNLMTPTILANEAVAAAKGTGIKVTVWDKARIAKERMGGLLGVSQGSSQEPRFIIMEYNGAAKSRKPVVFVGKGLTFDCGGISIKPSAKMEEMKYDMCGGANVIGTILAIAKLKLKVNVVALVPSTENLAGPAATKPGDVHTARNGKTFEVNNTDAEGRLILSDALSYATELEPAAIFDAATLTGAIVVALGNIHTGVFTRDVKLRRQIEDAAEASGELLWNMPLTDYHVKDMKGTYADLSNISSGNGAGSATAAAFLEQFVGEGIPWAHFDIAGTAWAVGGRLPYCPKKGASGAMIRTFVELAQNY
jgi:leucyl aminopeptidase